MSLRAQGGAAPHGRISAGAESVRTAWHCPGRVSTRDESATPSAPAGDQPCRSPDVTVMVYTYLTVNAIQHHRRISARDKSSEFSVPMVLPVVWAALLVWRTWQARCSLVALGWVRGAASDSASDSKGLIVTTQTATTLIDQLSRAWIGTGQR